MKKAAGHVLITAGALFLILGVPFLSSDYFYGMMSGNEDTVSSASVIVEEPSGDYVIYINGAKHPDKEKLDTWKNYFSGNDIGIIFEDISAQVPEGDASGYEMARSFQSRLPENQMKIRKENAEIMISKAEYGKYDIIIMSAEYADALGADTLKSSESNIEIRTRGIEG